MSRSLSLVAIALSGLALCGCAKSLHTVTKGPWASPVTMVAVTSSQSPSYVWDGTLSGHIDENGNAVFTASNGCVLKGVAAPKFDRWAGGFDATGCNVEHLNANYETVITVIDSRLRLNAKSIVIGMHGNVVAELHAEMQVSQPQAANL